MSRASSSTLCGSASGSRLEFPPDIRSSRSSLRSTINGYLSSSKNSCAIWNLMESTATCKYICMTSYPTLRPKESGYHRYRFSSEIGNRSLSAYEYNQRGCQDWERRVCYHLWPPLRKKSKKCMKCRRSMALRKKWIRIAKGSSAELSTLWDSTCWKSQNTSILTWRGSDTWTALPCTLIPHRFKEMKKIRNFWRAFAITKWLWDC